MRPGIDLEIPPGMSGTTVSQALQTRFEAIRRAELNRLKKKLGGLSDEERESVEAITADVIQAIANVPARALAEDPQRPALEAVVRLFALEA
jgi:glutamyl-tRNA reductase